jgi:putative Mg2+ transporter-C (MgtC) family protein
MLPLEHILIRLLSAAVLGGLFGLEREFRHKKAGMRTNILVALGSALAMVVSIMFDADQARIAAGVITGIGFLGGGLIIQSQGQVHGITTAATIWVVAAIGLACGAGYLTAAIAATLIGLATLYFLGAKKVREVVKLDE